MTVGRRLVEERKRLAMSQSAFFDACGVSKAAQYNFENDINLPGAAYLIAAAELGVDVSYVLTGVRNPAVSVRSGAGRTTINARQVGQAGDITNTGPVSFFSNTGEQDGERRQRKRNKD